MATFELISSVTVGSGGASDITFSSIASTWTDLVVKASLRGNYGDTGGTATLQLNGSTTSYSWKALESSGSSAYSFGTGSGTSINNSGATNANNTANTFGNVEFYIPNAFGSNYKSVSVDGTGENNATLNYQALTAGLWSNTSAITSIKLTVVAASLVQYSTAYLYGVKNA